jgi:hypothetical protein
MPIDKSAYIGKRLNHFVVIDVVHQEGKKQSQLKCRCDCGNIFYMYPTFFNKKRYNSCGCMRTQFKATHNGSKNPLYLEWHSMMARCHNKESFNYKDYGARGITVCEEWHTPQNFYDWVEQTGGRPERATLDRIDNNKGYSPENCKWATPAEQARNKRSTIMIAYNGKTQCLQDWATELGMNHETLRYRYHKGLPVEKIFSTKLDNRGSYSRKKP